MGICAGLCIWSGGNHCFAAPGSVGAYTVASPEPAIEKFDIFVADQISYDGNLYRLPSNSQELGLAPVASRTDWINLTSIGVEGEWVPGLQEIQFNANVGENRFQRNHDLNNTSGDARVIWDWRVGSVFLGDAGIDYTKHLAGFASTGFLGRDIVSRADYFADARYQLGPRWALFGGVVGANTTNTAPAVQGNDSRTKSGNGGVEIATSVNNAFGLEYRYADGHYTFNESFLDMISFNRDYQDNSARGYMRYSITEKTTLIGSAGYLRRTYLNSSIGAFSGDIWSASVQWQATDKTQVTFTASRDLQAYLDAQSDYFVSQGFSISPTWVASEKLTLKSTISWHDQNYISSSPVAIELDSRHDKVNFEQAEVIYTATSALTFDLACLFEQRASNQEMFKYHDTLTTASVTFKFL
jgi:hypothetical protein